MVSLQGNPPQHCLTSAIKGCLHSHTGSQNHSAEGCPKQELPTPDYSHHHISIKLDGSLRVKSTYIKILTGVCKGFLTSSSYQKHLSTGVSPQCTTANPRSVPCQGTWTNIQPLEDDVSTADCKHTATSGILKNKTSVHLSDNNPNKKFKRYSRGKKK